MTALTKKLQQTTDPNERVEVLNDLVKVVASKDPQAAIGYGKQALELAESGKDQKLLADAYHNLGAAYQLSGDYKAAADHNYRAVQIRETIGDSLGLCTSYNNIGNINNYLASYDKALTFYLKSLNIAKKIRNKEAISRALNNIGYAYQVQEKVEKAIDYYEQALPIKEEIGDKVGYTVSLINLGDLYMKAGELKKATDYLQKGLATAQETDHQLNMGYAYRGLAEAFQQSENLAKAADYALLSLEISEKQQSYFEIKQSLDVLNGIYLQAGNLSKAHEYLTLSSAYKDSIHNENARQQIEDLQVRYESEKKEKENLKLAADRDLQLTRLNSQTRITYLIGALLLTFAILTFVLFRGKRQLRRLSASLVRKNEEISTSAEVLRQQAVQLQEQKEQLEKSNSIKDKLFSIIAHDLRSPMVNLKGLLPLLRKGAVPEERKDMFLDMIEENQQSTLWLMDNLFQWARAQMDGEGASPVAVNLSQLAGENIKLLQAQAAGKAIRLESTIGEDAVVYADLEMTKLVLRNLISNAIKFCKQGDSVVVSAARAEGFIVTSVTDTGIGIPENVRGRLFDGSNFTSKGTANEKGSGLGLQLCKDFVERNGGLIWVDSQPGKGSSFQFKLPLVPAHLSKTEEQDTGLVAYA